MLLNVRRKHYNLTYLRSNITVKNFKTWHKSLLETSIVNSDAIEMVKDQSKMTNIACQGLDSAMLARDLITTHLRFGESQQPFTTHHMRGTRLDRIACPLLGT